MTLAQRLGLCPGDVLSVVGAGGKTTLIYRLARELSGYRTLVTTTTRMYFPDDSECARVFVDERPTPGGNGVYFLSGPPDADGKATACAGLHEALSAFDYTLIEADGAKGKLLKGWSAYEPVVIPQTTKTLGIINLNALGLRVTPENIHRCDEYMRLTGAEAGTRVTTAQLRALIKRGLFRKAVGERILVVIGATDAMDFFEEADLCVSL